jgi:hypothetical protein
VSTPFPSPYQARNSIAAAKSARVKAAREIIEAEVRRVIDRGGAGRINLGELFSSRTRDANAVLANQQANWIGQNALANAYGVDEYADVRLEAAEHVQDALARVGWLSVLVKWEETLEWKWPAEEAAP